MLDLLSQGLELLNRGGVVAILVVAVWALITEQIVPGRRYRGDLAARDNRIANLENRLDRGVGLTDKAISVAEQTVRGRPE